MRKLILQLNSVTLWNVVKKKPLTHHVYYVNNYSINRDLPIIMLAYRICGYFLTKNFWTTAPTQISKFILKAKNFDLKTALLLPSVHS